MNISKLLSEPVRAIQPSGIRKFFDVANEMEGAISLGVGEPDFVTPWHIRDMGIYSLEKGHTHYSANAGLIELRSEIANYLKRKQNLEYDSKKQIIVTVGGSEAIDLCIRSLISHGDEVLIPEPSFVCYTPCTVLAGGTPVPIVTKAENQFKLTKQELLDAITSKTKLLILPYPNNPTGAVMTKDELEEIASVLRDTDIMVLSDEIYGELTYEGKHVSIAELPGMYERTVIANGFSKSYAMTGWRLGYAAGHPDIIAAMTKIHQYAIMCAPTTSQYAAIEALKSGDADIERMRSEYNQRRRMIVDGFRKIGLDCFEPLGAFYVFPDIRTTGMTSDEFCNRLLFEQKVAVVPGSAFGKSGEGFIRVSYAYGVDRIEMALSKIEGFLKTLGKH